jgi:ABC-type bacteriocin/lantibiotic exporter with double-glycine peptidase domain
VQPRAASVGFLFVLALAAPACYTGSAHSVPASSMAAMTHDPSWQIVDGVPFVPQQSLHDCGPAALAMVLAHFRVPAAVNDAPELAGGDVRAGALRDVARAHGLDAFVVSGTFDDLFAQVGRGRPVLVGLAKPMALTGGRALAHYEVVIGINRSRRLILSLDPAAGLRENTLEGFAREWAPTHQVTIVFLGAARAGAPPVAGTSRSPSPSQQPPPPRG